VVGANVMGLFQTSGDMGLGHHVAAHLAAAAGMQAAKASLSSGSTGAPPLGSGEAGEL
jgi:hypothetical protein